MSKTRPTVQKTPPLFVRERQALETLSRHLLGWKYGMEFSGPSIVDNVLSNSANPRAVDCVKMARHLLDTLKETP